LEALRTEEARESQFRTTELKTPVFEAKLARDYATKSLYVGNVSWNTTEAELKEFFETFTPISNCRIPVDPETRRPRGFAFIEA